MDVVLNIYKIKKAPHEWSFRIVYDLFPSILEYSPPGLSGLQYNNNSKWGASCFSFVITFLQHKDKRNVRIIAEGYRQLLLHSKWPPRSVLRHIGYTGDLGDWRHLV